MNYWKPAVLALCALGLSGCFERQGRTRMPPRSIPASSAPSRPDRPPLSHAEQLAAIRRSRLRSKRILNGGETTVFWGLTRLVKIQEFQGRLFVYPQVSLGEVFGDSDKPSDAHRTINGKRADFCIVDKSWEPMALVEYQGAGHYGETAPERKQAAERDEIKRAASERAGILYHAIPEEALKGIDAYLRDAFLPLLRSQLGLAVEPGSKDAEGAAARDTPPVDTDIAAIPAVPSSESVR